MLISGRLENGMSVFLLPDKQASAVGIAVIALGGARDDPPGNPASHRLEHAMMRATKAFPTEAEITRFYAPFAHQFNAETSHTAMLMHGLAQRKDLAKLIRLLGEVVVHPKLDADTVRIEIERHDEESREVRDSRGDALWVDFDRTMFHRNNLPCALYSEPSCGAMLQKASARSLFFLHRKRFVGLRTALVITGGFDPDEAMRLVRYRFSPLRRGSPSVPKTIDFQRFRGGSRVIRDNAAEQINFIIGWPTFGFSDQQRIALGVLRNRLSRGADSYLKLELDSKGRGYSSVDLLWLWHDVEQYAINVSLAPGKLLEALGIIAHHVRTLRADLISKEELEGSVSAMATHASLQHLNPMDHAVFMAKQWAHLGRLVPSSAYIRLLRKVSRQDIRRVANAILVHHRRVIVARGPMGKITRKDMLEALRLRNKKGGPG